MDLKNYEYQAVMKASPEIGEHLEAIGKTDMATMSEEEWLDFLAEVYRITCEKVSEAIPF